MAFIRSEPGRGGRVLASPNAEGAEIHADHRLVELAADAGGEEVLLDDVGEVDPRHRVSRERQVDLGVGLGAGNAGEA